MRREIQRLQQETKHLGEENNSLREENRWMEQIKSSLKHDEQCNEIINRLKRGEHYQVIAQWLSRPFGGGKPSI